MKVQLSRHYTMTFSLFGLSQGLSLRIFWNLGPFLPKRVESCPPAQVSKWESLLWGENCTNVSLSMELAGKIVFWFFFLEGGGGVANKVSNVKCFIDHFTWINVLLAYSVITLSTHSVEGSTRGPGGTVPTRVPSSACAREEVYIILIVYVLCPHG